MRTSRLVVLTLVSLLAAPVVNAQRSTTEAIERSRDAAMRAQERVRERLAEGRERMHDQRHDRLQLQIMERVHERLNARNFAHDVDRNIGRDIERDIERAIRSELRSNFARERAETMRINSTRARIRDVDAALHRAAEARMVREPRDGSLRRSEHSAHARELRESLRNELQRRRDEVRTRRPDGGMSQD